MYLGLNNLGLTGLANQFSPSNLFTNGEGGAHFETYDPNSLVGGQNASLMSYDAYIAAALESIGMWQDSTGTTPVTAVEQPVGLWLDGKAGNKWPRGSEQWSDANVTFSGESTKVSPGVYRIYSSAGAYSGVFIGRGMTANRWYEVTFNVDSITTAGAGLQLEAVITTPTVTTTGKQRFIVQSTGAALGIKRSSSAEDIQISGVSVKPLLLGIVPATQSGSTKRPILTARVNLLTKTEQPTDPVWGVFGCTVTGSTLTATAGTSAAALNNSAAVVIAGYRSIFYVSRNNYDYVWIGDRGDVAGARSATFNIAAGTVIGSTSATASIEDQGGGVYKLTIDYARANAGTASPQVAFGDSVHTADRPTKTWAGTEKINLLKADFRTADDAAKNIPAYQRVNTSTDYDTVGFPHYLKFDGIDDCLQTGSIDFTAFDKLTLWGGISKLSDSAAAVVAELGTNGSSAGCFYLAAPGGAGVASVDFRSSGSLSAAAIASGQAAPLSVVATGIGNISGDISEIRLNNVSKTINTSDQGTGTYANAVFNIGGRNAASLFFSGRLYTLTARGSLAPTDTASVSKMNRYDGALMKISF